MERREKLDEIQTRESNSQTQAFHAVDTGNEVYHKSVQVFSIIYGLVII